MKDGVKIAEASLLIGVEGELFVIDSAFAVRKCRDPFESIGSGSEFAIGSLETTEGMPTLSPQARIKTALEIADRHCTGVSAPFHFEEI